MSKRNKAPRNTALAKYYETIGLLSNSAFREEIQKAMQTPFEVMVLGTMKAGKTTLLNALLGQELLPTDIDASTAIPYRIEDCDERTAFSCRAVVGEDIREWQDATPELLAEWNTSELCALIELQGNLPLVRNAGARLVLYDTPGPNNAVDAKHGEIARRVLESQNYAVVLYMLSARQLNNDDERGLLMTLKECLRHNRSGKRKCVIFVLSHADLYDEGKSDQSLPDTIGRQKAFLAKQGFRDPSIVPVMGRDALLIRMRLAGHALTDMQSDDLHKALAHISRRKAPLIGHTDCSAAVKAKMRKVTQQSLRPLLGPGGTPSGDSDMKAALLATGVPTLEACLEELLTGTALSATIMKMQAVFRKYKAYQLLRWLSER